MSGPQTPSLSDWEAVTPTLSPSVTGPAAGSPTLKATPSLLERISNHRTPLSLHSQKRKQAAAAATGHGGSGPRDRPAGPGQKVFLLPERLKVGRLAAWNHITRQDLQYCVAQPVVQLAGYQLNVVEQWLTDRRRFLNTLLVQTDNTADVVFLTSLAPMAVLGSPDAAPRAIQAQDIHSCFPDLAARFILQIPTDEGVVGIARMNHFPPTLNLIHVPNGDYDSSLARIVISINLKRAGFTGRTAVSIVHHREAIEKFNALYLISPLVPYSFSVVELIRLAQTGLALCGFLVPPNQRSSPSFLFPRGKASAGGNGGGSAAPGSGSTSPDPEGHMFDEDPEVLHQRFLIRWRDPSFAQLRDGLLCDQTVLALKLYLVVFIKRDSQPRGLATDESLLLRQIITHILSTVCTVRHILSLHGFSVPKDPFSSAPEFVRAVRQFQLHQLAGDPYGVRRHFAQDSAARHFDQPPHASGLITPGLLQLLAPIQSELARQLTLNPKTLILSTSNLPTSFESSGPGSRPGILQRAGSFGVPGTGASVVRDGADAPMGMDLSPVPSAPMLGSLDTGDDAGPASIPSSGGMGGGGGGGGAPTATATAGTSGTAGALGTTATGGGPLSASAVFTSASIEQLVLQQVVQGALRVEAPEVAPAAGASFFTGDPEIGAGLDLAALALYPTFDLSQLLSRPNLPPRMRALWEGRVGGAAGGTGPGGHAPSQGTPGADLAGAGASGIAPGAGHHSIAALDPEDLASGGGSFAPGTEQPSSFEKLFSNPVKQVTRGALAGMPFSSSRMADSRGSGFIRLDDSAFSGGPAAGYCPFWASTTSMTICSNTYLNSLSQPAPRVPGGLVGGGGAGGLAASGGSATRPSLHPIDTSSALLGGGAADAPTSDDSRAGSSASSRHFGRRVLGGRKDASVVGDGSGAGSTPETPSGPSSAGTGQAGGSRKNFLRGMSGIQSSLQITVDGLRRVPGSYPHFKHNRRAAGGGAAAGAGPGAGNGDSAAGSSGAGGSVSGDLVAGGADAGANGQLLGGLSGEFHELARAARLSESRFLHSVRRVEDLALAHERALSIASASLEERAFEFKALESHLRAGLIPRAHLLLARSLGHSNALPGPLQSYLMSGLSGLMGDVAAALDSADGDDLPDLSFASQQLDYELQVCMSRADELSDALQMHLETLSRVEASLHRRHSSLLWMAHSRVIRAWNMLMGSMSSNDPLRRPAPAFLPVVVFFIIGGVSWYFVLLLVKVVTSASASVAVG